MRLNFTPTGLGTPVNVSMGDLDDPTVVLSYGEYPGAQQPDGSCAPDNSQPAFNRYPVSQIGNDATLARVPMPPPGPSPPQRGPGPYPAIGPGRVLHAFQGTSNVRPKWPHKTYSTNGTLLSTSCVSEPRVVLYVRRNDECGSDDAWVGSVVDLDGMTYRRPNFDSAGNVISLTAEKTIDMSVQSSDGTEQARDLAGAIYGTDHPTLYTDPFTGLVFITMSAVIPTQPTASRIAPPPIGLQQSDTVLWSSDGGSTWKILMQHADAAGSDMPMTSTFEGFYMARCKNATLNGQTYYVPHLSYYSTVPFLVNGAPPQLIYEVPVPYRDPVTNQPRTCGALTSAFTNGSLQNNVASLSLARLDEHVPGGAGDRLLLAYTSEALFTQEALVAEIDIDGPFIDSFSCDAGCVSVQRLTAITSTQTFGSIAFPHLIETDRMEYRKANTVAAWPYEGVLLQWYDWPPPNLSGPATPGSVQAYVQRIDLGPVFRGVPIALDVTGGAATSWTNFASIGNNLQFIGDYTYGTTFYEAPTGRLRFFTQWVTEDPTTGNISTGRYPLHAKIIDPDFQP